MAAYRFTRRYKSHLGQWRAGDAADFDEDTAAWLQRDSPGCIEAVAPEPEPEPVADRAIEEPPADRMVRKPSRKRGAQKDGA